MPAFEYSGRAGGRTVDGIIEAASAEAVADQLVNQGITPVTIQETKASEPSGAKSPWTGWFQKKVALPELIMFSRQMYTLNKSGVPIMQALLGLANTTKNPALAQVEREVAADLEAGLTMSNALKRHPKIFSPLYVSLVQVGENTGRLDTAFLQASNYLDLEYETRQRIKSATRYPIMVIMAIVVAIIIINIFVVPAFADIFSQYQKELPLPTRILIGTSDFTLNYWPVILVALALLAFAFNRYVRTARGKIQFHRLLLRLPVIGQIFETIVLGRFSRSMAVMLRSGIPIIQSLQTTAGAVGNAYVKVKVEEMRESTERGSKITSAAHATNMFTPLVLQMIAVGEETGSMEVLLDEVADYYERDVDYDLKRLSSAIEPIMIVIIAAMVLVLALGVFLPLWELSSTVQ